MSNVSLNKIQGEILELLMDYTKLRPSEIRIFLETRDEHKGGGRTLDVQINRALKELICKKLVILAGVDNQRHTFYKVTDKGKKEAPSLIPFSKIRDMEPQKAFTVDVPNLKRLLLGKEYNFKSVDGTKAEKKAISTIEDITPEGKAEANVVFYLDTQKAKIEAVSENLKTDLLLSILAFDVVEAIKQAILKATKDVYKWDGLIDGPPQIDKMVNRLRQSLDFETMFFIHFNGRRVIEGFDWDKLTKGYERFYRDEIEHWPERKRKIDSPGLARDTWLNWYIYTELNTIDWALERYDYGYYSVGKDVDAVVERITQRILGCQSWCELGPKPAKKEEIEKIIRDMLEDGTIEPHIVFRVNKEKMKLKERKMTEDFFDETGNVLEPTLKYKPPHWKDW